MKPEIKICGLTTTETMDAALDCGAAYVGLVFFEKSPRHISLEAAAELAKRARGRAKIVALVVDADDVTLEEIIRTVDPDILQLHGKETSERVIEIGQRFGKPLLKAYGIACAEDLQAGLWLTDPDLPVPALALFDAKPRPKSDIPGGNGIRFDWSILDDWPTHTPYVLSGGLSAENIGAAVEKTKARCFDVSSGVEVERGVKDSSLIEAFCANAFAAFQDA